MEEMELTLREELFPNWIVFVLLLTIVVLSVMKSQKEMVFSAIINTFVKAPSSLPEAKESLSLKSVTNFLMLLNYFVVGGIAIYMLLVYYEKSDYWMVVLPGLVYLFQMLSLLLVIGLSGEFKKVRDNILLLNFSTHILGIILIPVLLIWLLNPHLSEYMIITLVVAVSAMYFVRLFRGMFLAIQNKVLWYYIILYLCGLEIWPIVVGYMLLGLDFIG